MGIFSEAAEDMVEEACARVEKQVQSVIDARDKRIAELEALVSEMDKLLTQRATCIAEAARIFELLKLGKPGMAQVTLGDLLLWLESDVVVRARNAAKQKGG